ncbi:YdcF family protein [Pseudonocardia adelaidensis]|uniref:YdcF family protein n=1 Tax=Pseudonocardia adelaidensis TaxID=648754 RepID=A0ABP9NI02_9PSEU
MGQPGRAITARERDDALLLWHYLRLDHALRPCDAAVGLGSHDLGVATHAAELYHRGMFPVIVFTGGSSPTTRDRFPRGEAVHYREHALALGVPAAAVLVDPDATNTGANIVNSRALLAAAGRRPASVLLISKPYAERRSHATATRLWPEVEVLCSSTPLDYGPYVRSIGDERLVIGMMVGELQRIIEYPARGFTLPQDVPAEVAAAGDRLRSAGFVSRAVGASAGSDGRPSRM